MSIKLSRSLLISAVSAALLMACSDEKHQNVASEAMVVPNNVVSIDAGAVRGVEINGVVAYKGIPFAAAPVGDLRWSAPKPVDKWQGEFDASQYGADCMQKPFPSDAAPLGTEPAEDCLFINVWEDAQKSEQLQPVVVWIHGGGFVNGGSSPDVYSGHKFAEKGVVFVSFNYRLGRFGFFAHPALTAEDGGLANYAYLDQVAAMKWVQDNIAAFGGDPKAVTVMGESAGGGSVLNLLTAAEAQGTFDKAIIMSGGGRGPIMGQRFVNEGTEFSPSGEEFGLNLGKQYGIEGSDAEALKALRALTAEQITDGLNMASMGGQTTYAGPMSDGVTSHKNQFELLDTGHFANVPLMIGTTSMDIGFGFAKSKQELFASFGDDSAAAQQAYDPDGVLDIRTLNMLVAADRMMHEPAHYLAGKYAANGQAAWLYRFSYVAESMRNEWPGAPHATDIPYFFNTIAAKYGDALTALDRQAGELSLQYFVNFVKQGNPNGDGVAHWGQFDPAKPEIMNISMQATGEYGLDPLQTRMNLVNAAR